MEDRELRKQKEHKKVTSVMKKNLYKVFFVILLFCGIVIGRLVYINTVNGDQYAKAVLSQQTYSSRVIMSERGRILDRNGVVLAKSEKTYNVILDPVEILSKDYFYEPTMKAITQVLGYDRAKIEAEIRKNSNSRYVVYEKNVDYSVVSKFNSYKNSTKHVVGVWFEEEFKRTYPYDKLASHVIGFTTNNQIGTYGIEQYYDTELTGTDGLSYGYFDSELNSHKTIKDAIDGNDIISTIDYNVQGIVQEKVDNFIKETGCKNIGVIVMNPNNAEIYAMASNREYNLNNPRALDEVYSSAELENMPGNQLDLLYSTWRNFCVSDTYEPGSTFKTITVASALEEDAVLTTQTFECPGYTEVGGWRISCNNKSGHGTLTLAESLMKSCNCALIDVASRLGKESFFNYEGRFGFGKKTGIDITGESAGIIIDRKKLNETELATSSFGTTFNVTMVQMAAAYCSIINGGTYYKPHVVKEIRNSDGTVVKSFDNLAIRQTVSASTSEFIRNALYMTVEKGTATLAKVDGYLIGGKTGTAQKHPREEKKYVVSFAGFAPVNDPQVLVYIVIDEVQDESVSRSCTPAMKMSSEICSEIFPYLGIYPEGDIDYHTDISMVIDDINNDIYDSTEDEMNPDVLPEGLEGEFEEQ